MRKLRWLERSIQKITTHVTEAGKRLVRDWVVGSVMAGTTILSGVARALHPDKRGFEAELELLSRGLRIGDRHGLVVRRSAIQRQELTLPSLRERL